MASKAVEVAHISVKVSPNTKEFRRKLKSDLDQIEQAMKVHVDVEPHLGDFRKEVAAKTKGMEATVKVKADVDKNFFSQLGEKIKGIDPASAGTVANVAALSALIPALAATAVGLVTTALVALPGLIAAVATPIGALALGMDGLKKAAEVLKAPLEDLKATMSAKVQEQFTPVFEKLGQIFPTLKSSLPFVTQGLATMADAFAGALTRPEGLDKLRTTFQNIGFALQTAGPGVSQFTDSILTLASKFSEKLPSIAQWFNDIGTQFNNWVTKISENGDLSTAFDGLGQTLKTIVDVIGQLGSAGVDFMKNPENIANVTAALQFLGDVLTKIVQAGTLASETFTSFTQGLAIGFSVVGTTASAAWQVITNTFGSAGSFLSGIWEGITSTASSAWDGVVSTVQNAWNGIVGAVSSGVANVVSTVTGMVTSVVGAIANLGAEGLKAGTALVQGLINGIGGLISSAISKAQELASGVAGAVKSFLGINSPSKLFNDYGVNTAEGFINGLESMKDKVAQAAQAMAAAVPDSAVEAGSSGLQAVFDVSDAIGSQLKNDLNIGGGVISAAVTAGVDFAEHLGDKAIGNAYHFNISSVDEAMSIKDREESKQALSIVGRK